MKNEIKNITLNIRKIFYEHLRTLRTSRENIRKFVANSLQVLRTLNILEIIYLHIIYIYIRYIRIGLDFSSKIGAFKGVLGGSGETLRILRIVNEVVV